MQGKKEHNSCVAIAFSTNYGFVLFERTLGTCLPWMTPARRVFYLCFDRKLMFFSMLPNHNKKHLVDHSHLELYIPYCVLYLRLFSCGACNTDIRKRESIMTSLMWCYYAFVSLFGSWTRRLQGCVHPIPDIPDVPVSKSLNPKSLSQQRTLSPFPIL